MKTKELIRQLQKADPSGEAECCVNNIDIHFVSNEPAYWDGTLEVLQRDESNKYYNIIGAKYVAYGTKVVIRPLSIADAIFEDPKLPVDYSNCGSGERASRCREANDRRRKEALDVRKENEIMMFIDWVNNKALEICEAPGDLSILAKAFFDDNLHHDDPMPEDIASMKKIETRGTEVYTVIPSYRSRRHYQWNREISLSLDGLTWSITKKPVKA